jgi:hypothetical protein
MRGRWLVVCSLSAVSYVASPSVASPASNPQVRRGFWLGFGGGLGSADATCDACSAGKRESGVVGYFNLGGTIHNRLLLGAEVNLWSKDHEGVTLNLYNILATATIYPQPSSNYFLKVGAGGTFIDTDIHQVSRTITVDLGNGLGLLVGAGYDFRVWTKASVTAGANFWYGRKFASDKSPGTWKQNVVDVTLGITFH